MSLRSPFQDGNWPYMDSLADAAPVSVQSTVRIETCEPPTGRNTDGHLVPESFRTGRRTSAPGQRTGGQPQLAAACAPHMWMKLRLVGPNT